MTLCYCAIHDILRRMTDSDFPSISDLDDQAEKLAADQPPLRLAVELMGKKRAGWQQAAHARSMRELAGIESYEKPAHLTKLSLRAAELQQRADKMYDQWGTVWAAGSSKPGAVRKMHASVMEAQLEANAAEDERYAFVLHLLGES